MHYRGQDREFACPIWFRVISSHLCCSDLKTVSRRESQDTGNYIHTVYHVMQSISKGFRSGDDAYGDQSRDLPNDGITPW